MHTTRTLSKALAAVVAGGVIGTLGWQVGLAAAPQVDTLAVCQRAGADLRSPATNGTCPSGYTLVEITETLPTPPAPATAYHATGVAQGAELATQAHLVHLDLPTGTYTVVATGTMNDGAGGQVTCFLGYGGKVADQVDLETTPAEVADQGAMSGAFSVVAGSSFPVGVYCFPPTGPEAATSDHSWQITATKTDLLIEQ